MSELKVGPTQFQEEIARLKSAGKLPELHEVLGAVADARRKFAPKIKEAQEEGTDASNS